ncbi:hypothetical protein N779_04865 [Vibrio coralliilyticus OCN008]|nr:hypothetical protein N779_04865 [Vibrio coralliilyticus OCN008]
MVALNCMRLKPHLDLDTMELKCTKEVVYVAQSNSSYTVELPTPSIATALDAEKRVVAPLPLMGM